MNELKNCGVIPKAAEGWRSPKPGGMSGVRYSRSVLECASPLSLLPLLSDLITFSQLFDFSVYQVEVGPAIGELCFHFQQDSIDPIIDLSIQI